MVRPKPPSPHQQPAKFIQWSESRGKFWPYKPGEVNLGKMFETELEAVQAAAKKWRKSIHFFWPALQPGRVYIPSAKRQKVISNLEKMEQPSAAVKRQIQLLKKHKSCYVSPSFAKA